MVKLLKIGIYWLYLCGFVVMGKEFLGYWYDTLRNPYESSMVAFNKVGYNPGQIICENFLGFIWVYNSIDF